MENKYYFLKRLYPKYVIIINNVSLGSDTLLMEYIKCKDINYIKFDSDLNVIEEYNVLNNMYDYYLIKILIGYIINSTK